MSSGSAGLSADRSRSLPASQQTTLNDRRRRSMVFPRLARRVHRRERRERREEKEPGKQKPSSSLLFLCVLCVLCGESSGLDQLPNRFALLVAQRVGEVNRTAN